MTTNTITTADIAVGDVSFHLSTAGDPDHRPVLWLHGSGPGVTALTNWEALLTTLSGDFYNIAPDIIGFGDSTHPATPPQGISAFTELRVETLLALLDHLGIDEVDIVGNSMGAIIGLCLTLAHPHRVRRLVLMGPGGAPIPPTPGLLSLIRFYDDPTVEAMSRLLTQFVADPSVFDDQLEAIASERMPRATRSDVERSHRATFAPTGGPLPITAETMATLRQPVLLVHGDSDRIIAPQASHWYADVLPDARLQVIEDAGHWLQLEQPTHFADLLRDFLGAE
ncbi:alpha/beta fold hydrolase [Mycobacteroides abscessus]|uniref:alpha/beta fold hydrolase n=1 Tax=Mycobacteroides abscessus TaxID=36809 RepID=UPI000C25DCAF|nr:alpha/beta hydrolase [Mycobacteroides abscessus]